MKKVILAILKALAYFAVYVLTSNVVTLIVSYIFAYMKGREYAMAGIDQETGMAMLASEQASITGICLAISAVLTLIIYAIIEKVKKSSLPKETDMKKASAKQMLLTVIGALGGMFFMNFIMSILPIPASLTDSLNAGMSTLTAYPFWQAILANCLLVPIIEEVVFRGYIFNRLAKAMPSVVAALISSAVFGLAHGGILWAIWAFVLGMLICTVRIKSGSIIPGMVFHIIMNTFAMVVSYFPVLENMTYIKLYALTIGGGILLAVYVIGVLTDNRASKKQSDVMITTSKN